MRIVVPLLALLGCAFSACAQQDIVGRDLPAAENYEWAMRPAAFGWELMGIGMRSGAMVLAAHRTPEMISVDISYIDPDGSMKELRVVAFDAQGKRYEFSESGSVTTGDLKLKSTFLNAKTLAADKVKFIGVEKQARGALQNTIAPAAYEELTKKGVDAFPFPLQGNEFIFNVKSVEGPLLRSADLHGKIVVLDFWATWCAPCMASLEEMKQIYADLRAEGVEFIAVSLDHEPLSAEKIKSLGTTWPNVLAPIDENRKAWENAAGVRSIPRAVIIDRLGWVRDDLVGYEPSELREKLEQIIQEDK